MNVGKKYIFYNFKIYENNNICVQYFLDDSNILYKAKLKLNQNITLNDAVTQLLESFIIDKQ